MSKGVTFDMVESDEQKGERSTHTGVRKNCDGTRARLTTQAFYSLHVFELVFV
jgi:hypothetical protein